MKNIIEPTPYNFLVQEYNARKYSMAYKTIWQRLHLEPFTLTGLLMLAVFGLIVLYSAANQDLSILLRQCVRFLTAFFLLFMMAQIPPRFYQRWAPMYFGISLFLLIAVLVMGHIGNGAQRWLSVGIFRFQPSEFMKLGVPLMLAHFLDSRTLPPDGRTLFICTLIIAIPSVLIARQPDLGTALMVFSAGCAVLLLAGISRHIIMGTLISGIASAPILWHFMHQYQRQRVLTFLNPERDPLRAGYHIIQSKIAIGSGGIFGKGWLHGTQSHLNFLPEHATDFIYALIAEEFGLLGTVILLTIYFSIAARGLYIATQANNTFGRLLAGSISLMFFLSAFINMGMVTGLLPVVGIPLPLISYGGTSIITLLAGFGVLMSIHTHPRLVKN